MNPDTLKLLEKSGDFVNETLDNGRFQITLYYFRSICDMDIVKKEISHPFFRSESAREYKNVLNSAVSCTPLENDDGLTGQLLDGFVAIKLGDKTFKLKAGKTLNDQPSEAVAETTIQGPQNAFSEDVETNLLIIRRRYPLPELISEELRLGKLTRSKTYLLYDKNKVDPTVLKKIKDNLNAIDVDTVQAIGQIESLITNRKYRWFPVTIITERPDRAVLNISQGKIVLIMDGTPYTMIAPAVFFDFISAMDDIYQSYMVSRFLVILRYVALIVTITLPALYIAIVSYNPEIFRVQFTLSIAGSRAAVPYPSFVEVMIMLFLIEALIEASLRLPRFIGSTATTVGGLILGQAAQQAGLVSSIMIIITSVVAISNFLIPINAMSFAMRIAKYPLIVLASCFGFSGLVSGVYAICLYAANLDSFGKPYFHLFYGEPAVSGYKEGDLL